jgi:hypothetical protein
MHLRDFRGRQRWLGWFVRDIRSLEELKALGVRITEMQKQIKELAYDGKIKLFDTRIG